MTGPLYPLRFEPIFKSMLWGGRQLPEFLRRPTSGTDPIGEAWVLSDVDGNASRVANGPLAGRTLRDLLSTDLKRLLGKTRLTNGRFPLLLKFIDAKQELSVQVHPNDDQAHARVPGANGKTEAWVILEANPQTSRIYAGFRDGVGEQHFRSALQSKTTPTTLHSFTPKPGDCVFLPAGTVHAIGADILLFEVQQTSDITYRLYDWDRVDTKTGRSRDLHIDDGLTCSDFATGPRHPVEPKFIKGSLRERLVNCSYFTLDRLNLDQPIQLGAPGEWRIIVVASGQGTIAGELIATGDVVLIPAELGVCEVVPSGVLTIFECGLPE